MTYPPVPPSPDVPGRPGVPGPYGTTADPGESLTPGLVAPVRRRTGVIVGGVVGGVLVLGGLGAWAAVSLGGGGAQPASVLPASSPLYLQVDLDPSAGQKVNLMRLAGKFPDLSEAWGIELDEDTDVKQVITDALADARGCEIDYAADVEPWLGDRFGVAMSAQDEDAGVLALAVKDEDAAREALESGLGCQDGAASEQVAFSNGYAIITTSGVAAADVVAEAEKAPLADADLFTANMDALGDTGVLAFWMDAQALKEMSDEALSDLADDPALGDLFDGSPLGDQLDASTAALEDYESIGGAVRATPDALELVTSVGVHGETLANFKNQTKHSTVEVLPQTTLFALAGTVDGAAVEEAWAQLPQLAAMNDPWSGTSDFDRTVDTLAYQYDIHLPEDLVTLLGEQVIIAIDSEGLDDVAAIQGTQDVNLGLRTVGDTADLQDLADRINTLIARTGSAPFATAETGDGFVLATNDRYAKALTGDGTLGDSETYRSVTGDDEAVAMFLDIDALTEVLRGNLMGGDEMLRYVEPLRAIGVTSAVEGNHALATVRISFD